MKPRPNIKSNDPKGERPATCTAAPHAPLTTDLAHFRAKLAVLKEMGVGSYRGPDGETVNFWPDTPAPADPEDIAAQHADEDTRTKERGESLWTKASGGMLPKTRANLPPELRRRLP